MRRWMRVMCGKKEVWYVIEKVAVEVEVGVGEW